MTNDIFSNPGIFFNDMHLLPRLKTNLDKNLFWMKLFFSHTERNELLKGETEAALVLLRPLVT